MNFEKIFTIACGSGSAAELAPQCDLAVIMITKREVLAGVIGDLVDRLMVFSEDASLARKFMGRMILTFDGYNHDARELTEIPEVVRFFVTVTEEWPYWLHFLDHDLVRSIRVALCLYLEAEPERRTNGKVANSFDMTAAKPRLSKLLHAMRLLHERIDLPAEDRVARLKLVDGLFDGLG